MIDNISLAGTTVGLVLMTLFMGIIMVYLGHTWKRTIRGVRRIGYSLVAFAAIIALKPFAETAFEEMLVEPIYAILIIIFFANKYRGIKNFRNGKIDNRFHLQPLFITFFSLILIVYSLLSAKEFLKDFPQDNKMAYVHMGGYYLTFAGLNIYRIIYVNLGDANLPENSTAEPIYFFITTFAILIASITFIVLVNRELIRMKNQFFSIVAHDIKNPLSTIIGYSEILRETTCNEKEKRNEHLDLIRDAAGNSLDLINNIMEWSRVNFQRIKPIKTSVSLIDIIDDIHLFYKPSANIKKVEIITEYKDTEKIETDPVLLNTILRNLYSNAIKYSPENESILISISEEKGMVKVAFTNYGPHVKEDILQEINNHKVIPGKINKENEGSGLGLYLSGIYIKLLGGGLFVENLTRGCRFTLMIPRVA
jgi:signal transduction histidine kinase